MQKVQLLSQMSLERSIILESCQEKKPLKGPKYWVGLRFLCGITIHGVFVEKTPQSSDGNRICVSFAAFSLWSLGCGFCSFNLLKHSSTGLDESSLLMYKSSN